MSSTDRPLDMASRSIVISEILKGASNRAHRLEPGTQKHQKEYFITIRDGSLSLTPDFHASLSNQHPLGVLHVSPGRLVLEPRVPRTHHIPKGLKHLRYSLAKGHAVEVVPIRGHLPCTTLNEGDQVRFDCYVTIEIDRIPILDDGETLASSPTVTGSTGGGLAGKGLQLQTSAYQKSNAGDERDNLEPGSTLPDLTPQKSQPLIQPVSATVNSLETRQNQGEREISLDLDDDEEFSRSNPSDTTTATNGSSQASAPEHLQGNPILFSDPMTDGNDRQELEDEQKSTSGPLPEQTDIIPQAQVNDRGTVEFAETGTMAIQENVPHLSESIESAVEVAIPVFRDEENNKDQGEDSGIVASQDLIKDGACDNTEPRHSESSSKLKLVLSKGQKRKLPPGEIVRLESSEPNKRVKSAPVKRKGSGEEDTISSTLRARGSRASPIKTPTSSQSLRQTVTRLATVEDDYQGLASPRVLFSNTSSDSDAQSMKLLKSYGGKKVENTRRDGFDILVVGNGELKKTSKLLFAVIYEKSIVREEWLVHSVKADRLLSIEPFLLVNPDVVAGVSRSELFKGKTLYLTPALKKDYGNASKDIIAIAKVCGASSVESKPARGIECNDDVIVLASQHNDPDRMALADRGVDCFTKALLSFSVLRGRLETDDGEFKIDPTAIQDAKCDRGEKRR